jgi:amino acid transporter
VRTLTDHRSPAGAQVPQPNRITELVRAQSPMAGLDRRNLAPAQVFAQSVSGAAPAAAMAVTPAIVAARAGEATIWAFAVAIGLALLVSSCIGRFTRRMAAAGSLYSLTAKGLGPAPALLAGGGLLLGYGALAMAALTGSAIQLVGLVRRLGVPVAEPVAVPVLVVLLGLVVGACARRGVRLAASVVLLAEAVSIGLMLVVFGTLLAGHGPVLDTRQLLPEHVGVGAVAAGVLPALAAFIGFEAAAAMGVEARRPFRTIPRAVRGTAALTGVLSLLAAYTQVARFADLPGGLAAQPDPVPTLAAAERLPWLSLLLDLGLASSFFACALATSTALVRLLFSAGREGVVPHWLGHAHRRFRTPDRAIALAVPVLVLVPVAMTVAGAPPARVLVGLLTAAALGYLLAYLLVCLAAPVFLHRIGELTGPAVAATSVIVPVLVVVLVAFLRSAPGALPPVVAAAVVLVTAARYGWLRLRWPDRVRRIGLYDETSAPDLLGAVRTRPGR